METRLLRAEETSIREAARLIRAGKLVGFPTETVYGLGADALNAQAVLDIFAAKGRPADNPLIVHITAWEQLLPLCHPNAQAEKLAQAFWPGPLTMILPKKEIIPAAVTAGLDSVALRMPSHPVARALIAESGCPIAAPSGNRSGRPSPTLAAHMMEDMAGIIPLVLDGGPCQVGVESTVVSLTGDTAEVLRPGGVTPEMIAAVLGECRVCGSVMRPLQEGEAAPSPGMKHKHYAPKARMTLYEGTPQAVAARIAREYDALPAGEKGLIFAAEEHLCLYGDRRTANLGKDAWAAAHSIFALLRQADAEGVTRVLSESWPESGVGLAVMNRMARAAGFDIVKV